VLGLFIAILFVAVTVNAIVRSAAIGFGLGVVLGVVRVAISVLGLVVGFWFLFQDEADPSAGSAMAAIALGVLGPLTSAVATFAAHHRREISLAIDEEAETRLFLAWLPVLLLDAIFVVIGIAAALLVRGL
jgi:hypothetical protein